MVFHVLRKHMKTVMWAVAILIVPAFVIWNIGSSVQKRKSGFAGTLYGKRIPLQNFLQAKLAARNELLLRHGPEMVDTLDLDEQAWTRLILLSEANRRNIKVSDEELMSYLKQLPLFTNENVTAQAYSAFVAQYFQNSPAEFESGIRDSLRIEKLIQEETATVTISDDEVQTAYKQDHEQITAEYFTVPISDFTSEVPTDTEDALRAYYTDHQKDFETPQQVRVEYIAIPFERFKDTITPSEEQIKQYYEQNKEQFPADAESTDQAAAPQAYKSLDSVRSQIQDRLVEKEMKELAMGSARQAINLLYADADMSAAAKSIGTTAETTPPFAMFSQIPRVGLSYPFMQAAFSVGIGEISEIVETPTALYIIKPLEKIPPHIPQFEEITETVRTQYQTAQAGLLAAAHAEDLRNNVQDAMQKKSLSFRQAAEELGLTVETTEPFSRKGSISGIGYSPEFAQTAFAAPVATAAGPVRTEAGYCVLCRSELIPVAEQTYNAEKEQFRQKLLQIKRNEKINAWFEELKQKADPVSFLDTAAQ